MAEIIPDVDIVATLARQAPQDGPEHRARAAGRIGAALDEFFNRIRVEGGSGDAAVLADALERTLRDAPLVMTGIADGPVRPARSADHDHVLRTAEAVLLEVRRNAPTISVDEALLHVKGWLQEQGVAEPDRVASDALMALMKRLSSGGPVGDVVAHGDEE
jgi:hypothetical protein